MVKTVYIIKLDSFIQVCDIILPSIYYLASALKCTLFNINLSIMKKKNLQESKRTGGI